MPKLKNLTSPDTLIVMTFAKAGLGHMRVTYALMEGLPGEPARNATQRVAGGAKSVLFSSRDNLAVGMHRISSTNPVLREIAEAFQRGFLEDVFTSLYTRALRRRAKDILPQIEAILGEQKGIKRVIFVSTHFGLAHQLSILKEQIKSKSGVEAKLVVVVTDDSPQHAWFVPEADLITVPSETTKRELVSYGKRFHRQPKVKVTSYPVSLELGQKLAQNKLKLRQKMSNFDYKGKIKVSLPVSGAAVGLNFYAQLASKLNELEPRFSFYVTSRDSAYTKPFLAQMKKAEYAKVYAYKFDRDVVSNYIKVMHRNTISLEVTKPSEQAFKALYSPKEIGGVILLFARPIGRQEYDNLWFLARHGLIPNKEDQEQLWQASVDNSHVDEELLSKAKYWRGVRLMHGSAKSAQFIYWCLREGIFESMMSFSGQPQSGGVREVWGLVDDIL